MSSARAGGGSGSAVVPANARKTIQSLKEIVTNSEDEIYAVLKECNMDPDETVQRLLNQDPFHEVKRKRDKKKGWNKDGNDGKSRSASGGTQRRGGRGDRDAGRGGPLPRHGSNEFSGGRGKSFAARENGNVNTSARVAPNSVGQSPSNAQVQGQGRSHPPGSSQSVPATAAAPPPPSQLLPNGGPAYVRPAAPAQGSWGTTGSGHATMADIVKANGSSTIPPPGLSPGLSPMTVGSPVTSVATVAQHQYLNPGTAKLPVSSGVYSSSTDPVLHPSIDSRSSAPSGAIKREIGTVGNQRSKGEWSSSSHAMDAQLASPMNSQSVQTSQTSSGSPVTAPSIERDAQVTRSSSPPVLVTPPLLQQDRLASVADPGSSVGGGQPRHGSGTSSGGAAGTRTPVGGVPFSGRPGYLSQQHPVGTQKATGAGLEWKPKLSAQSSGNLGAVNIPSPSEAVRPSSPPPSGDSGILSAATSKLQGVTIHDEQPVIIPNHLQVGEAEQTHLSFGSFGAGFGTSFTTTFVPVEDNSNNKATVSIASESAPVIETPIEPSSTSSVPSTPPVTLSQSFVHESISAPEESVAVSSETAAVSLPSIALQNEVPKPDPVVATQQSLHASYVPPMPNAYSGFNVLQQVPVSHFAYEPPETQAPDVPRLPSLVPYPDPASYYGPLFRPGSDGDGRYPSFVTSNTSSKYNGSMSLASLAAPNLPSQESASSVLPPVAPAQTSQSGNAQTVSPVPQQHLQLHAYTGQPGGAPLAHPFANVFGYQYIPSYPYMHTHPPPYQHNYTANSVYPQGPTGSSYPPAAAATTYPPGGATAVKYQLPQYKPASATGIAPHSAVAAGYGGYSSAAPSGYAANPSVTVGSTSAYEDVGQQYKDNMYIPSQQVEGSTVFFATQLSREMQVAGMQPSSYYNIPGQAQPGAYAHTQQPAHAHAHPSAYANLYHHPSQSGQAPSTHQQLLQQQQQQPQSLGAGGGSQVGSYQQPQRNQQQTWNY